MSSVGSPPAIACGHSPGCRILHHRSAHPQPAGVCLGAEERSSRFPPDPDSQSKQGVNDFDRFVEDLQRQIDEQERTLYSAQVLEHARNPRNIGPLESADGFAATTGPCGDTMEIYLRLDQRRCIRKVAFLTDGCGPTLACGSMLTLMVRGLSIEKARTLSARELIIALNGLPGESAHCAELAVNTFQAALQERSPK